MTRPFAQSLFAFAFLLSGCASDAMNNRQATGFDGFLKSIQVECAPLFLGGQDMSSALQAGGGDDNYSYFLDQTSKLYYRTIGPGTYRESLTAFFGPGYGRALNCIIGKLPPPD